MVKKMEKDQFMRKKFIKPFIIFISIVVLTFAIWQLFQYKTLAEPVTTADAENIVTDIYKGEIKEVTNTTKNFVVTIELNTGTYEIKLDRQSGDILKVSRLKEVEPNVDKEKPVKQDDAIFPTPNDDANIIIPKEEAVNIALKEVKGDVDDVDFEEEDGISYYFIEIERSDDMEATIQINAVTGEIKTITWDD